MALFVKKVKKSMQDYKQILELYKSAFPKNERIPLCLLKWDCKRKNIDFLAFYDDENFNTERPESQFVRHAGTGGVREPEF